MEMTGFVINAQSTYIVYGKLGCLVKEKSKLKLNLILYLKINVK